MKRLFLCLLPALLFSTSPVKADDWGCEVIMCLANPAGPMAASACIPPITRLFAALSKKKPDPFPTCESANGAAAAKQGYNYFDACPSGTQALEVGASAIQIAPAVYAQLASAAALNWSNVKEGIGEGDGASSDSVGKVCVGRALGLVSLPNDNAEWFTVAAYEQVLTLDRASSPRYIDVLLNNKPFTRVRF